MNTALLVRQFARIGARLQLREVEHVSRRERQRAGIDIRTDESGEFFDIRRERGERVEYEVVDLRPELRHLLLLGRREGSKEKYLCGHDERHWFVCAVPGASVSGVASALAALQPLRVRMSLRANLKRQKNRFSRRNEPLSRGAGSKPHTCQFAYRFGGELVWVCTRHPRGVSPAHYERLIKTNPKAARWDWQQSRRNPAVYVRGRVWHGDHKTVVLDGWHRVVMNTEAEAPFAPHVAFLD